MSLYILKGLCIVGIILNLFLMYRKMKEMRAVTEPDPVFGLTGEELWQQQKKHNVFNFIVGVIMNFGDTLGIGSFAGSSAAFKIGKSVDDINVPGTLNVGDTVPVLCEAFLFFGFVDLDTLTLVSMIVASVLGSILMAGVVSKLDRKHVRIAMFIGLAILGTVMLCKVLEVGPFGSIGTALKLTGVKLIIAVVVNFVLGALMSVGVGLYAPCMALCSLLGLNVGAAFPVMMGSCAFLMAFGNGPKFIKEGRYDMAASWMQAFGGAIGVFIAYKFVSSIPLKILTIIVVCVVYVTAVMFLHDAIKKGSAA